MKGHLIVLLNVLRFLMTNDVEHIFKWLPTICIFVMQLKKLYGQGFYTLLNLLLIYILDTNRCIANIFSLAVACHFIF